MAKKTNVPLKRRRRSELNVKLIAIIAAVLFVVTIGIVFAVIGSHKKENNPSVADNQNNETTAEPNNRGRNYNQGSDCRSRPYDDW